MICSQTSDSLLMLMYPLGINPVYKNIFKKIFSLGRTFLPNNTKPPHLISIVSALPPTGVSVSTPSAPLGSHPPFTQSDQSTQSQLTPGGTPAGWTQAGCCSHICRAGLVIGWSHSHQKTGLWVAAPAPYQDRGEGLWRPFMSVCYEHPKRACACNLKLIHAH